MLPLLHKGVLLAFMALLVWAAVWDLRRRLIPDWISIALVVLYLAHALTAPANPDGTSFDWLGGVMTGVAVFIAGVVLFGLNLVGGGDVKLLAAASFWAGPAELATLIFVTAVTGGVIGVVMLVRLRLSPRAVKDEAAENPENHSPTAEAETEIEIEDSRTQLPYGLAIACGGCYLAARMVWG